MNTEKQNRNTAIIGGGVNGAALALRLAQQGKQVTLYEKLPEEYFSADLYDTVAPERGHSVTASAVADQTSRSLRYMWERLDHPLEAVKDTRDLFLEVQEKFPDQPFVTGHPSVMLIHKDDDEMLEGMRHQVARVNADGGKMEIWDGPDAGDKLRAAYPALKDYDLPEGTVVVHEEGYDPQKNPAGVSAMINPAAYLRALHRTLKENGVEIRYDAPVENLSVDADGKATVTAQGAEQAFDHVTVAAGGWSRDLLGKVDGLQPIIEETPKRVRWTDVQDKETAQATGTMPFIQAESLRDNTETPHRTLMPATVGPDGVEGVKLLFSAKTKFKDGANGLASSPITADEVAEDRANFKSVTGLEPSAQEESMGKSCMITATPDKMMTSGIVRMKDGSPSPISALSACSYASFVVGGAAVNALAAEIDGKEPPYPDWKKNHAPNRDIEVSERAAEERTLKVVRQNERSIA